MNSFDELLSHLIVALAVRPSCKNIKLMRPFANAYKPMPMKRSAVCIGIDSISLEEGGMGTTIGFDEQGKELSGQKCQVRFAFEILCPIDQGSDACLSLFGNLCDEIFFSKGLPVVPFKIGCSKTGYSKENDCFFLSFVLDTYTYMTKEDVSLPITEFIVRKV